LPHGEVIPGDNAEGIGYPVEEREQSNNIHRLRNLLFFPSHVPEFLYIFSRRAMGRFRNQPGIFEQGPLSGG